MQRISESLSVLVSFGGRVLLVDGLDDTDGDGLLHVADGEPTEGRVLGEDLAAHGLGRPDFDEGRLSALDEGWVVLQHFAAALVDLGLDLLELAGDVRGVAVQDWGVPGADLAGVVQDDDLRDEGVRLPRWVVGRVATDVAPLDVLVVDLDVEADVVAWDGLQNLGVVHLDGLDLGAQVAGGEGHLHSLPHDTGLDPAHWDGADTADLVDVLNGHTQRLVGGSLGWDDGVEGLQEGGALVPVHLVGLLDDVVAVEAGQRHEGNVLWVVADLLEDVGHLVLDLLVAVLPVVYGLLVHLVDADDDLLHSKGVGEQGVLSGLAPSRNTRLELTSGGGHHEQGTVGLARAGDHVLDEVPVAWGVDDGVVVLGRLELPEGNVDGDAAVPGGLELVHDPGVLEAALACLVGLLLQLLEGPLLDTSALVDQVAAAGRLTGVDVADNHDVDVGLGFVHIGMGLNLTQLIV